MEVLVAILWYLQLILPCNMYTLDDISKIADQNKPAVSVIQNDQLQTDRALIIWDEAVSTGQSSLIEEWEEDDTSSGMPVNKKDEKNQNLPG